MPDFIFTPLAVLPFPDIDPVVVRIGPLAVHWYGLAYVFGILLAWRYARRIAGAQRVWADGQRAPSRDDLDDLLVWAALGVIAGGKIGHILFYDYDRLFTEPLSLFANFGRGMSFHGGALGTILAMVLFARARAIPVWSLLDTVAAAVPIGLLLGRIANFVNAELWGRPSDVAWAFIFPTDPLQLPRHPSQLYEAALEGAMLFAVLAWLVWRAGRLKRPGYVGGAFVAGYGLARIAVEFFREPDAHIGYLAGTGWLTMGMVLSLPMVLAGGWAMATARPVAPARA